MMIATRLTGGLVAAGIVLAAATASAQGQAPLERGYVHVNVGVQATSHNVAQQQPFELYEEPGTFSATGEFGGGGLFDIGGGYRIRGKLYAGLSYTRTSDDSDLAIAASVPHPFFTDTFRSVSGTATGLNHTESAVHLQAVWRQPVTTEFDVAFSIGPTIFSVSQDLVTGVTVTEVGSPTTGANFNQATVAEASETTIGFNVGVDGSYMFTPRLGAGAFLRYTGGSADLESGAGAVSVDVGGFQAGAGIRFRF